MSHQIRARFFPTAGAFVVLSLGLPSLAEANDWAHWRGPLQTGQAPDASPPTSWDANKNVLWKTPIPGRGHSTPVVWGDQVFLTSAVPVGEELPPRFSGRPGAHDNLPVTSKYEFRIYALDRRSGRINWSNTLHAAVPVEGAHQSGSLASASPVVDSEHLFVFFGSFGLYCLTHEGDLLWKKHFGQMHTKHGHGEGASPALHGKFLAINWDHEEQSFVTVLDKSNGQEIWKKDRDEVTSWSTPIIADVGGNLQLIVCGTARVRGYELETGDVIWQCGGLSANIVATPIFRDGVLWVGSSYEKRALLAINIEKAVGDLTDTDRVLWSRRRGTPYVPSMLLVNDGLYFLAHYQNILTRVDSISGSEAPGPMRLGPLQSIYASPVASQDHIFITDLVGTTIVITADSSPTMVSINSIGEPVNASLAMSGGNLWIRGEQHLFCIGETP